jgi:hypothetical protein
VCGADICVFIGQLKRVYDSDMTPHSHSVLAPQRLDRIVADRYDEVGFSGLSRLDEIEG